MNMFFKSRHSACVLLHCYAYSMCGFPRYLQFYSAHISLAAVWLRKYPDLGALTVLRQSPIHHHSHAQAPACCTAVAQQ
jgi:hypothetical protein